MKTKALLPILCLGIFLLYGCKPEPHELLAREWQLDKERFREEMRAVLNSQEAEEAEARTYENIEALLDMMADNTLLFREDSTFVRNIMGQSTKGRWKLNPEGTLLTLRKAEGGIETLKIQSLSKEVLLIESGVDDFPLIPFVPAEE